MDAFENLKKRAEELRAELNRHARLYYEDDAPEISDFQYDELMRELQDIEEKYPTEEDYEYLSPVEDFTQVFTQQYCPSYDSYYGGTVIALVTVDADGNYSVADGDFCRRVVPVPGKRIDLVRHEQLQVIVVPERLYRQSAYL